MTEALADGVARARALATGYSFVVEAAAGSGKTALLTQRLLVLLAQVEVPEEVLAITFTRKAAAEMRGRVLAALDLAVAAEAARAVDRLLQQQARAVLARDAALGWRLREQPQRLRIMTIDALCGMLVRRLPLQCGLPLAGVVTEDPRELHREAARRALLAAEDDEDPFAPAVRRVLDARDNDWQKLEALLVEMLGRRDQWLEFAADPPTPAALDGSLQLALAPLFAPLQTCPPGLAEPLEAHARTLALAVPATSSLAVLRDFCVSSATPAQWTALADVVLTRAGTPYRNYKLPDDVPAHAAAGVRDAWRKLAGPLHAATGWTRALAATARVPAGGYDGDSANLLDATLTLLRLLAAHWRVLIGERQIYDFTEQALAARDALGGVLQPTDLTLALDYQLRHLLVDEFQDTSRAQYQLLERLTAGWGADDGRTLFFVGDPLQSIYRFRDADVNLFGRTLRAARFGSVPLEVLRLSVNFRTRPRVIDWLNDALGTLFANTGHTTLPYRPLQAVREDDSVSGVTVEAVAGAALADAIIARIESTWARQPDARIAILVRSRLHLGGLPTALAAAGIALATNDIDALSDVPLVSDLIALTRALYDPTDRIAWFALLRAPWCGIDLDALLRIAGTDRRALIWRRLGEDTVLAALPDDARQRVGRLCEVMAGAFAARGRVTWARLVEATWRALAEDAFDADMRQAARYLDLLATLEREELPLTAAVLARRVGAEFAPFPRHPGRAVEIMTVHRAKGLEFDTVIVPELQRGVQSDRRPLLLVHQPGGEPPLPPIPVALPAAGTPGDALFSCLMQHNRDAAGSESLRLLYVALTRARESLHLYRDPAQRRAPDSFLAMLHASVAADEPPPPAAVADEDGRAVGGHAARAPLRRRLARLPATPVPPPPAPVTRPPLPFEWASPLARPIGTVTHRYLQVLAEAGDPAPALPARSALQVALREQGLRGTELMHAVQEVESLLRATLASTRGRWLLSGAHRDARSELRLTTRTGVGQVGDLVIDRTFVTADGVRWIVDYKTGNHEGGDLATFLESEVLRYRPQLEAYARALAVLDTAPIRLGLYYPRLDAWREWAAGDTT